MKSSDTPSNFLIYLWEYFINQSKSEWSEKIEYLLWKFVICSYLYKTLKTLIFIFFITLFLLFSKITSIVILHLAVAFQRYWIIKFFSMFKKSMKNQKKLKDLEIMYQNTIYICIFWYRKICWFPMKNC